MTLPRIRNPPSRSTAIPGSGVTESRFQLVLCTRALSAKSLAQRRISVTPTRAAPTRCLIWSGSAAMPWQRSNIARARSPDSSPLADSGLASDSMLAAGAAVSR